MVKVLLKIKKNKSITKKVFHFSFYPSIEELQMENLINTILI